MFTQNGGESLDGTKDSSMNDDWATETWLKRHLSPGEFLAIVLIRFELLAVKLLLFGLLACDSFLLLGSSLTLVLQVETNRLLEIDLDGTALVLSLKSIIDLHVDLGSVEGTITMVECPGDTGIVKSILKGLLSNIPSFFRSEFVLRAGRELELESESKDGVDVEQEVQSAMYLSSDLVHGTEDMGIILLEASNSNKTAQSTGDLVSMEDTEVSESHREITITVDTLLKHDAMSRTIH